MSLIYPSEACFESRIHPCDLRQCLFSVYSNIARFIFSTKNGKRFNIKQHRKYLLVSICWNSIHGCLGFWRTPRTTWNYIQSLPWNFRFNVEVNTLQEWYLINTSPSLAHPLHIHVNHFQVCKQRICWRRTIIDHKVSETLSEKVVSILKLLFVNLDWNKLFKFIITLEEKLSQILQMVWYRLAPICSLFPV